MPKYVTLAQASTILRSAERILVVGCSGGGKTTLSIKIAEHYKLEYISIDRDVRWLPNWVERNKQQQRAILTEMVQRDRWVIDGSGSSSFDIRLPRADLVIWVRVPRLVSLLGIACRAIKHLRRVRPAMAAGCPERIPSREFLSYIWNFEKIHAPKFIHNIDVHKPGIPVVLLRSHEEANILQRAA